MECQNYARNPHLVPGYGGPVQAVHIGYELPQEEQGEICASCVRLISGEKACWS